MMTSASVSIAKVIEIPYAARLYLGASSLATTAVRKGPSAEIIIHANANGYQSWNNLLYDELIHNDCYICFQN